MKYLIVFIVLFITTSTLIAQKRSSSKKKKTEVVSTPKENTENTNNRLAKPEPVKGQSEPSDIRQDGGIEDSNNSYTDTEKKATAKKEVIPQDNVRKVTVPEPAKQEVKKINKKGKKG